MANKRLSVTRRREELLAATAQLIAARGADAVRIGDIASELGVSNALVLYHFSTKENLVAAAFAHAAERELDQLARMVRRRTTAIRRLRAVVRWYAPIRPATGWPLWIEAWAAALHEPAVRQVALDFDRRWKAALTEVIAEGVAAGEFHCPDPASSAHRLTALLDGLAVQVTAYDSAVPQVRVQQWADEALARELHLEWG